MALIHGIGKINKAMRIAIKDPVYAVRLIKGVRRHGLKWALDKSKARLFAESLSRGYSYDEEEYLDTGEVLDGLARKPLISVVMPVYNVETRWLDEAVKSVLLSTYDNFELILVDDCSTDERVIDYLGSISDSRVKVARNEKNLGISGTSNRGIEEASGEYIVMMDNDDLIHRNAILHIAADILAAEPDLIYSDEDKTDQDGIRKAPFYKPDWSPDLLRSQMYIGHIFAFRKGFFLETGGFRKEFDGAQDYDLALRMSERTSRISHIPKVLYSWRELPSSTAMNPDSKPYAHIAGLKALDGHLKRVFGQGAYANETDQWYVYDARYPIDQKKLLISVIIDGTSGIENIRRCIKVIRNSEAGIRYEIIVLWEAVGAKSDGIDPSVRVVDTSGSNTWGERANKGVNEANGDILIFIDARVTGLSMGFMERLSEKASRTGTGIVGSRIVSDDGGILSAGVTVLPDGTLRRLFKGSPSVHYGTPFVSPLVTRNILGADGILIAVARSSYDHIGSFSVSTDMMESCFDYGVRSCTAGLLNVYDPHVRAELEETGTLTCGIDMFDLSKLNGSDPYSNIRLNLKDGLPVVPVAPRMKRVLGDNNDKQ
ncbi:glycosyltransferase family 2 protein [Youngiibacter multivorans]|uniref:Glycosyltransferase involved in cell wall biosynthesis n=1 Tax=Youngiibacter multivorans TaxID=937251 RepID=A0ABS4G575_9CLOT|nr:glycosyltransferase [Youngiibacter multivorans]MBP1919679.1 glycosyltransferase involved in cell wall biosynthesis [Youngiibacter multivorans]